MDGDEPSPSRLALHDDGDRYVHDVVEDPALVG
jgi:hypothetical protein